MTQQEFTERTGVKVCSDEFEAINVVYNQSDVDKDEFCKLWCKMNAIRVKAAKEAAKKAEEREKDMRKLEKIYNKLKNIDGGVLVYAAPHLTVGEGDLLEKYGISLFNGAYYKYKYAVEHEIFMELIKKAA